MRVWELHRQLAAVQARNEEQRLKNAKLASEVQSLNEGTEAIEERARSELSMIKKGEIFIQLLEDPKDDKKTTDLTENQIPCEKSEIYSFLAKLIYNFQSHQIDSDNCLSD